MDQINKCLEELRIQSSGQHNEKQENYVAGKINNVIKTLDIVVVKPYSSKYLLYFGSPLFLSSLNYSDCKSDYALLGYIDDIFGSIGEPMYSVSVKCDLTKILDVEAPVYYFLNNPSTAHMYVEYVLDETINKEKYNIRMLSPI